MTAQEMNTEIPVKITDSRRTGFFIIQNEIVDRYGPEIGAYGLAVYMVIARHSRPDGTGAFPSHKTIADKAGCGLTKTCEILAQLSQLGLIVIHARYRPDGSQTSNEYELLDPPLSQNDTPPIAERHPPYRVATTINTPISNTPDNLSPASPEEEPEVLVVTVDQTIKQGIGSPTLYKIDCPDCGNVVVFSKVGDRAECINGHILELRKKASKRIGLHRPALNYSDDPLVDTAFLEASRVSKQDSQPRDWFRGFRKREHLDSLTDLIGRGGSRALEAWTAWLNRRHMEGLRGNSLVVAALRGLEWAEGGPPPGTPPPLTDIKDVTLAPSEPEAPMSEETRERLKRLLLEQ